MDATLKAPFPWFGGKSRVAADVWERFGDVPNYVEPFAGSLAVLLGRPHAPKIETVNDLDGYVANFWRAMTKDPEAVAHYTDNPVNECDLHARHLWLIGQRDRFVPLLMGNPEYYDAKIAGWWVWGLSSWIGFGWCSGNGPWVVDGSGMIARREDMAAAGVKRSLPHLGNAGQGVNRQLPHLGTAGMGVNRQLPHLGNAGRGVIMSLAERLRGVRVACGDWSRVCGESPTIKNGLTGILLDPPYEAEDRATTYTHDSRTVAADVWAWAVERGTNPLYRIAVCAYDDGRTLPDGWTRHAWKAQGGYGSQGAAQGRANAEREVIYFSPHCLTKKQGDLFG